MIIKNKQTLYSNMHGTQMNVTERFWYMLALDLWLSEKNGSSEHQLTLFNYTVMRVYQLRCQSARYWMVGYWSLECAHWFFTNWVVLDSSFGVLPSFPTEYDQFKEARKRRGQHGAKDSGKEYLFLEKNWKQVLISDSYFTFLTMDLVFHHWMSV